MDASTVFTKTDLGREEIKTRALKLPSTLRTLLIAVDGIKSVGTLTREYPVVSGVVPLLEKLAALNLITAENSYGTAAASDAPADDFDHFRQAAQFMNESTALLGLSGYFLNMKIQRCSTLTELRSLAPAFRSAMTKRLGDSEAEDLMRRFHDLIGRG